MMKLISNNLITSVCLMLSLPLAAETTFTDLLPKMINNEFTCEAVEKHGKGRISKEQCIDKLSIANKECSALGENEMPFISTVEEAKRAARIMMVCPYGKDT